VCFLSRQYQSAVGSLMYLMVGTRPDLAFAVGAVSQFMACPTKTHWEAVEHIFRYVSATTQLKLALGQSKGEPKVVGYSDARLGSERHQPPLHFWLRFQVGGRSYQAGPARSKHQWLSPPPKLNTWL